MPDQSIIDRIYEAAVLPSEWPSVLSELETIGEGDSALVFASDDSSFRFVGSERGLPVARRYLEEGWSTRTDRVSRLFQQGRTGFLTDLEIYTQEEIDVEPVYTDFLRPNGLGWGAATGIVVPSGERMVVSVEREYSRGPVPDDAVRRLDRLRPHLARAITLSNRLGLQAARTAVEALDLIGSPAVVFGRSGVVRASNAGFEHLAIKTVKSTHPFAFRNTKANTLLQRVLDQPSSLEQPVRSIPFPASSEPLPMVFHLIPIRARAADIFGDATDIGVFTVPNRMRSPSGSVLEGLFDLTPAESALAASLATMVTVEQFAEMKGKSIQTVRTQLKAVLSKTGTTRQSELISLLIRSSLP